MAQPLPIIVVGASAGGVEALGVLAAGLPSDLAAAVFVVLHVGAHKSELPALLSRKGPLKAVHPKDGDPIRAGRIYVAPPDHHLVVEPGHMRLTRGPRENWARPAVDPLFRSAAQAYGADVVGVILTGGLNDGTAGLYEVGRHGGTTVVQDPAEAVDPGMPRSALKHVAVDHRLPLAAIVDLLPRLVAQRVGAQRIGAQRVGGRAEARTPQPEGGLERRMPMTAEYKLDIPVAVTCPDCGGALQRKQLGSLVQFPCHIGHVYTAEVMVAAQFAAMEWSLEAAMRALSERGELCRQMGEDAAGLGESATAARWEEAMREAKDRTLALRELLDSRWTHPGEAGLPGPADG